MMENFLYYIAICLNVEFAGALLILVQQFPKYFTATKQRMKLGIILLVGGFIVKIILYAVEYIHLIL
jgi:hypothetical protein